MILAVDIGNTNICFALTKKEKVLKVYRIDSMLSRKLMMLEIKKVLLKIKKLKFKEMKCVVCSVVPAKNALIRQLIQRHLSAKPQIIGRDIKIPIKNNYRNPKQVGQDRLVCAYGAREIYKAPLIIIDFGTAITFDIVSRNGTYEGGLIVPGIKLSLKSLFKNTALLPNIKDIKKPKSLIGKTTSESILGGILFGYGQMCNGLIEKLSKQLKGRPKVILTGGYSDLMAKVILKKIHKVDKNLVFKGMAHLAGVK